MIFFITNLYAIMSPKIKKSHPVRIYRSNKNLRVGQIGQPHNHNMVAKLLVIKAECIYGEVKLITDFIKF